MFSTQEVQDKYRRQAKRYDFAVQLYRLLGLHIESYRVRAVELLQLRKGDRVVDLGCGTGLNFPLIIERIGSSGRLIGVDLTPEMLECAGQRVEHAGWKNVELVESDIATYDFPDALNGVLSTGVFGYVAEYERVIEAAAQALVPGGKLVIVDGKQSQSWPSWLFKLFACVSRPFGVTPEYFRHPCWKSVERCFPETTFEEMYGGLLYISSGTTDLPTA